MRLGSGWLARPGLRRGGRSVSRHGLAAALALVALLPNPARAVPIEIDLTISFNPQPPPIIPTGATYTGIAQFSFSNLLAPGPPPIDIGSVAVGGTFFTAFSPAPPPIDQAVAFGELFFSFGGSVLMPAPPPIFPMAAFLDGADLSNATPTPPPILPIGSLGLGPAPPPIHASGNIVAFDAPEVVGTFDITVRAVPEPATLTLLLGPLGLLLLLAGWRRFPASFDRRTDPG